MSPIENKLLEEYIKSSNKQEFLQTLTPGSREFFYFQMINLVTTKKTNQLTQEEHELISNVLKGRKGIRDYQQFSRDRNEKIELIYYLNKICTNTDIKETIQNLKVYGFDFQYSHQPPSNISSSNLIKQEENFQVSLNSGEYSLEKYIEMSYSDQQLFSRIETYLYTRLDLNKILQTPLSIFQQYCDKCPFHELKKEDVSKILINLYQLQKTPKNSYTIPSNYYQRLTYSQLEYVGKKSSFIEEDRLYIGTLFQKQFASTLKELNSIKLDDMTIPQLKKKKEKIKEMNQFVLDKLPTKFQSLRDQLLFELLHIDAHLNQYDQKLFLDYLDRASKGSKSSLPFKASIIKFLQALYREKQYENHEWWYRFHGLNNFWQSETALATEYLKFIFQQAKDISPYSDYLDEVYLKKIFNEVKLLQGKNLGNIEDKFLTKSIDLLRADKEITITKHNVKFYEPQDQVVLGVYVKNIPKYTINLYEIDLETYYKDKLTVFDNSLSLEGILPAHQQLITDNTDPIQRNFINFPFPEISNKQRGLWLIDFIGNGISSRAIIRKGSIICLCEYTVNGHLITLINEKQQICKSENKEVPTGIWLQKRFYPVNKEGRITIPYVESEKNETIVLVHEGFADLTNITLKTENYDLKCDFIYQTESFLEGNKAKILVQPKLYVNKMLTDLNFFLDSNIEVIALNASNIPYSYRFADLKLNYNKAIELDIPIKNQTKSLSIKIQGHVNTLNDKKISLSQQHQINFNLYENKDQLYNLYLKRTSERGYQISYLGKNGEPQANKILQVTLAQSFISNKIYTFQMKTDAGGNVYLGFLYNIKQVTAQVRNSGESQKIENIWNIDERSQIDYPSLIRIVESDEIQLPFMFPALTQDFVEIYEHVDGNILSNIFNKAQLKQSILSISGLKEGTYTIVLKELNLNISVEVLKGNYWEFNKNYIIDDKKNLSEGVGNQSNLLAVLDTFLVASPDQDDQVDFVAKILLPTNVGVNGVLDNIRAHVFCFQFMPNNIYQIKNQIDKNKVNYDLFSSTFGLKKSNSMNNKVLGDEACYVIDRVNQPQFIGNTLEKPQILLKRTEVRDTQFEKENLTQDVNYKTGDKISQKMAEVSMKQQANQSRSSRVASLQNDQIDYFLNFLEFPGLLFANNSITKEGDLIIKNFPNKTYSGVIILLTSLESNSQSFYPFTHQELKTKDLRHKSTLKEGEYYSIMRSSKKLMANEQHCVPQDSENVIVENIAQLFDIQKLFKIATHQQDNENDIGYEFWNFLKEWNNLNLDQKLLKYDLYVSHELNLFIYFKDYEFYLSIIKDFIKNKIEKTFVDYFLLEDSNELKLYEQSPYFDKLNSMEKNLLLLFLVKSNKQRANELQDSIQKKQITEKQDNVLYNHLFDTVLSTRKDQNKIIKKRQQNQKPQDINYNEDLLGLENNSMQDAKCMEMEYGDDQDEQEICYESRECEEQCKEFMMDDDFDIQEEQQQPSRKVLSKKQIGAGFSQNRQDLKQEREKYVPGFQNVEKTKEYVERTYYNLKNRDDSRSLIIPNKFWSDLAQYIVQNQTHEGFLSESIIYAANNHAEMILALAFSSLSFGSNNYKMSANKARQFEILAGGSNLLLLWKEIQASQPNLKGEITIAQRIFDPKDRFQTSPDDPGIKMEKNIEEFLYNKIYGTQIIVTNCCISDLEFQILSEIPTGSLPVRTLDYTKSTNLLIPAYSTQSLEIFFYFPFEGQYSIYSANVSREGKVLAVANQIPLIDVKSSKTIYKMENFSDILEKGSKEDIFTFLREKNLLDTSVFKFDDIYWLLQKKDFYQGIIQILDDRGIFNETVWQYSFFHEDTQNILEWINSDGGIQKLKNNNLLYFNNGKINFDTIRLFEYHPLLSNRVHNFMKAQKNKILNIQFKETYQSYLNYLVQVPILQTHHLLVLSYYLILQERIEEAVQFYDKIDPKQVFYNSKLQYDYLSAYLDIYTGYPNFQKARKICEQYVQYPVISWRNLFIELSNQLMEHDGDLVEDDEIVKDSEYSKNVKVTVKEESLSFELHQSNLVFTYINLSQIEISYYVMDIEILFSRSPFLQKQQDQFAFVRPNQQKIVTLVKSHEVSKQIVPIPQDLQKSNLFIQIVSSNQTLNCTYFSTELKVQVIENYGQVKVTNNHNQPLNMVYVKVYSKDNSDLVSFWKDGIFFGLIHQGYTDMRGRFDYALSSSGDIDQVKEFSILVVTDASGAQIKEAKSPNQLGFY